MRSIPTAELDLYRGSGVREYRVRARRPEEAAWTEVQGYAVGVRADGGTPDQPAGQLVLTLVRDDDTSPGVSASALNTDAALAFRPMFHPGRSVEVDVRVGDGVGTWHPWRLWLQGEIQDVEWPGDDVVCTCTTLDGVLQATQIEAEEERGAADPGTPLQTEIQGLLDRWMGAGVVPLLTVGDPAWGVGPYTPSQGSLGEQIRTLAQGPGWDVRYKWSEADQDYRYTLYLPPRDKTAEDLTLPTTELFAVPGLKQSLQYVRNAFPVEYVDAAGKLQKVEVIDQASIDEYRRRAMPIREDAESAIKTAAQATALGGYAKSDLSKPLVDGRYEIPFLPWIELHDVLVVQADGARFDYNTKWAVVGVSHRVEPEGGAWTEVELRGGTPVGAYYGWHRRGRQGTRAAGFHAILKVEVIGETATTRTVRAYTGAGVDEVAAYTLRLAQPVAGQSTDAVANGAQQGSPVVVVGGVAEFTFDKPPAGYELHVDLVPLDAALVPRGDAWHLRIDPVQVVVEGELKPTVTNTTADLAFTLTASASAFPVVVEILEDDPDAAPIATHTFTADGTITEAEVPALGNRALPQRELRRWYARMEDTSGHVHWAFAAADRDSLPWGHWTADDYRANPGGRLEYDDDTDAARLTTPGGRVKTWGSLSGGGALTYTVGVTVLDDSTAEAAFTIDETRGDYRVEVQGGGEWRTIWEGPLHGRASNPPTVRPRVVLSADRNTADVYALLESPVGESLRLHVRDAAGVAWSLVAGSADSTARYVATGTEIGAADWFHNGSAFGQPLNDVSLKRDQLGRLALQAQGEESAVRSTWTEVPLEIKAQPWLESVDLVWDEDADRLVFAAVGGAHCASATLQVSPDVTFASGITQSHTALLDGQRQTLTLALALADREKLWHARAIPYNGPLSAGLPTGITGEAQRDSEFVPEVPRPRIHAIRETPGADPLHRDLELRITAPKNQGGTLYVHTNKGGTDDANPDAASGTLTVASTPLTVGPATAFNDASLPLNEIPVYPTRGKTVYLRFVSADGGDTGLVPFKMTSGWDLVGPEGELVADAVNQPAQFASALRPFRRENTRPASGNYVGDRVAALDTGKAWEWDGAAWLEITPAAGMYSFLPFVVANSITAKEAAIGAFYARHLNVAAVYLEGIGWTSNSPGAGSVAWTAGTVIYQGVEYAIGAGNTAAEVVWWRNQDTYRTALQASSAANLEADGFDRNRGDEILALNESGTVRVVWNGTRIYGGQITTDAIQARHLAALIIQVGKYIQSANYAAGTAGWKIDDTTAELNDVVLRGILELGTGTTREIRFNRADDTTAAQMRTYEGTGTEGITFILDGIAALLLRRDTTSGARSVFAAARMDASEGMDVANDLNAPNFKAHGTNGLGFYGAAASAKPTVSGARGGNAALDSLLQALATLGLITNSTT